MKMPEDYDFDDTPFKTLEEHACTHRALKEYGSVLPDGPTLPGPTPEVEET